MAWYLMYKYNPEIPDTKPSYRFFHLKDTVEECDVASAYNAQTMARLVWAGFLSGFAHGNKGKISDPELVWRMKLEVPPESEVLSGVEEVEVIAAQGIHDPDHTAEQ